VSTAISDDSMVDLYRYWISYATEELPVVSLTYIVYGIFIFLVIIWVNEGTAEKVI